MKIFLLDCAHIALLILFSKSLSKFSFCCTQVSQIFCKYDFMLGNFSWRTPFAKNLRLFLMAPKNRRRKVPCGKKSRYTSQSNLIWKYIFHWKPVSVLGELLQQLLQKISQLFWWHKKGNNLFIGSWTYESWIFSSKLDLGNVH